MNEEEWLACEDPTRLIFFFTASKELRRKLRLLTIVFARPFSVTMAQRYPSTDFNRLLDSVEEFADGGIDRAAFLATVIPVRRALPPLRIRSRGFLPREFIQECPCSISDVFFMLTYEALDLRWFAIICTLEAAIRDHDQPGESALQLRGALCNFVRDIFGNPFRPVTFAPAWRTNTALALARQMYESREFGAMPILADALQDAGCDNDDVLNHCRGDGPHVRGCWVVDLVLGKT